MIKTKCLRPLLFTYCHNFKFCHQWSLIYLMNDPSLICLVIGILVIIQPMGVTDINYLMQINLRKTCFEGCCRRILVLVLNHS